MSPILYNLYTADIPKSADTQLAMYADDTAIYSRKRSLKSARNALQRHLHRIENWAKLWRIKINEIKTTSVIFTKRRPKAIPELKFNDKNITYATIVKYLGIDIDRRLCFKTHCRRQKAKALGRLKQIYPLLCSPVLPLSMKLLIYKAYIRPILEYANPAWAFATASNIKQLQVVQNKALRIGFGFGLVGGVSRSPQSCHLGSLRPLVG